MRRVRYCDRSVFPGFAVANGSRVRDIKGRIKGRELVIRGARDVDTRRNSIGRFFILLLFSNGKHRAPLPVINAQAEPASYLYKVRSNNGGNV